MGHDVTVLGHDVTHHWGKIPGAGRWGSHFPSNYNADSNSRRQTARYVQSNNPPGPRHRRDVMAGPALNNSTARTYKTSHIARAHVGAANAINSNNVKSFQIYLHIVSKTLIVHIH